MPVLRRAMPVLRRLKGWNAVIMHGTDLNPADKPHWSGLPWDDSDIVDKIMDYPTKKQAAKKPATKTAVKTKAECGGSPDSDIVDNIMYYPTKKQAAKKPATKKAVKTKAEKTKAVKTKEAVKTKVATRLSAK